MQSGVNSMYAVAVSKSWATTVRIMCGSLLLLSRSLLLLSRVNLMYAVAVPKPWATTVLIMCLLCVFVYVCACVRLRESEFLYASL